MDGFIVDWQFYESKAADQRKFQDLMERHKPESSAVEAIVSNRGFDGKRSREKLDENGIHNGLCPRSPRELVEKKEIKTSRLFKNEEAKKPRSHFYGQALIYYTIRIMPHMPKEKSDRLLEAEHGIMHITVTPIERSHVPIKRRYHATSGFINFNNASLHRNFEYIQGYLGGTNVSSRQQRFEIWDKIEFLVNKKAF